MIDYGVCFLFLLGMALCVYAIGLLYRNIETLKLITLSASVYFTLFVLVSGALFWADRFAVLYVLTGEVVLLAGGILGLIVRRRKLTFVTRWEKRGPLVLLIILIGFLVSFVKFDFFGMGQDQGVYQTKAIALAYGTTEKQYHFEGIESLPDQEIRDEALESFSRLNGYDLYDSRKPTLDAQDKLGETAGIFHGIPTFPALMALFIQMFGLSSMQQIQSIFYLCTACFVLLITEGLGLKKSARLLAVSVVALSPVVQWVMKSALTEGFLCLLYAGILYGMLDGHPYSKYLSALFIWGFAFFHVTIYVMIPLFAVLFMLLYLETKDKQYLLANCIAAVGFAVGITMMCYVSPTYSFNNIANGFSFFRSIGEDKTLPFMWGLGGVLIAASAFLALVDVQKIYGLVKKERVFTWLIRLVMMAVIVLVIRRGVAVYRGEVDRMAGGDWRELERLTLLVFGYATGVFAFCLTLVRLFLKPAEMLKNKEQMVIGAAFFYCVLLMSALIRKEIVYLYYYARYLAPNIVVCAIAMGAFLNVLSKRILAALMVGGAAVLLPFDWTLTTQKDDSLLEWDVVENVLDLADGEGAAVVDGCYLRTLMLPLETATDFDTYPLVADVQGEIDLLKKRYDDILVIAAFPENTSWYDREEFSVLYRDQYDYAINDNQYIFAMSNDLNDQFDYTMNDGVVDAIIPFAHDFYSGEWDVSVLECDLPHLKYDFSTGEIPTHGMGAVEEDYFCWLNESGAGFTADLEKREYEMIVTTGPQAPLDDLGIGAYCVDVYVNDHCVGTITQVSSETGAEYKVPVPEEAVVEGKNDISFIGETWSPAEYGSEDSRTMTISLQNVEFVEPGLYSDQNTFERTDW